MKKILVPVVIMLFLVGGCATVGSFFGQAQDTICNAPAAAIQTAQVVIDLLTPIAVTLLPQSAPWLALVTAQKIKDGGCVALTDLNALITFIQGFNTAKAIQAQGTKAPVAMINVQPLLDWQGGK